MMFIHEDETLEELNAVSKKIVQKKSGFRFAVDAVLIAHFINIDKKSRVLDIGTGTGIIPLLISDNENIDLISAIEIQDDVADMARRSVFLNGLDDRIEVINEDVRYFKRGNFYDFVVTNPPYMKLEGGRINTDPMKAVSRHEIKLTLEELIESSKRLLKPGGSFNIIYRTNRFLELVHLLETFKFGVKRVRFVHSKPGVKSELVMLEAMKGKKLDLEVLEPLYIEGEDGQWSEEVKKYY